MNCLFLFRMLVALACLGAVSLVQPAERCFAGDSLPEIRVENVRRVFDNGEHNAFTDMIHWNDKYWLAFRTCPDGHMVSSTASVIVLNSDDAMKWDTVHQFSVPLRDTRDPHFLAFDGKLFVYTGTWYSGEGKLDREAYDINKHLGYAVWTEDGKTWSTPHHLEGTYGSYIWRVVSDGDTAYLCGRRKRGYTESESGVGGASILEGALLESRDGLNWTFRSLFQTEQGNETAFQILPDGTMLALSRERGERAQLARSQPPYLSWERSKLPLYIGGPLLAEWGDQTLVAGRKNTSAGPKTALYWLVDDELEHVGDLPSGGDNSYPGFVAFDDQHGLISWYSSHEKDESGNPITAIYVADIYKE
ncbi:hypothetical protein [Rubinisphaera margarita]|uniref:hypothetical protein n=1 Tax=Rubinisphaera margarita TaxID=2909586 RepID=UPI001EE94453|nr:hypothetical protein [Rubinisphaera margarita]MCG6158162.1 hypothetical protein [Rubinisphaera margarita]